MKINISLKVKTIIATFLIISFIVIVFSSVSYTIERNENSSKAKQIITDNIHLLSNIISLHVNDRQKTVNTAMNLAHSIFYNQGKLVEDENKKIEITAVNQITKNQHKVKVNSWFLKGEELHNNTFFVDTIKKLSVESVTLFQKIDEGYLRIATNVMTLDGERAIGTFIPNNSEVIKTIETGATYTGRAYVVSAWYLTAYEPVYINNQIKGILYVGVREKDFPVIGKFFTNNGYETGNTVLISDDGKTLLNKLNDDLELLKPLFIDKLTKDDIKPVEIIDKANEKHTVYYTYNDHFKAFIVSIINNSEFEAPLRALLMSNILYGLINVFCISFFLILFFNYQLFHPINNVLQSMIRIARKDVDFQLDDKREDEIGLLYKSVNAINKNFKEILINIHEMASSVFSAGTQLSSVSLRLSDRASEQASTTEEIATSMEEILATINSNTERAVVTGQASAKSADRMTQSNETFSMLLKSVAEISDKISIITEIAGKTDILSVNAAIEAARAGEVGEGFAVVAHEIRKLADITKNASHEIIQLSKNGQEISKVAGKKMAKAIPDIIKSAKLVKQIVASSQEQQIGIQAVNTSMQQLTEITNENSASAEEMSASAEQLTTQAEQLKNLISVFKIGNQHNKIPDYEKISTPLKNGVLIDLSNDDEMDGDYRNF